jgi:L-ascorbate metabolism protein UlaG (beta-lactamase superfamily)
MRTLLKRIGTALLFIVVAFCLAPTVVPPFLDRIYYEGPPSDHFDGARFFNPDGDAAGHGSPTTFINRFLGGDGRAKWPDYVPVVQTYPPAEATLCPPFKRVIAQDGRRCVDTVDPQLMAVTWIGHSTVLVQAGGLNILTDPVWSERASPFSFLGPKRVRTPGIRLQDLPKIDLILVSHNHYDHMDLPTLKALWDRDQPRIITSLGNDTILRNAGIGIYRGKRAPPVNGPQALDWGQGISSFDLCEAGQPCPGSTVQVTVLRNHHWGSRWGTDRNRALWSAFKVQTPADSIFFAGDTGWGDGSWVREAAAQGPYRLAIIPIGAYAPRDFMKSNHIDPEEAVKVFEALRPTMGLGVHWGTFQLTFEPIDEPRQKLEALKRARGISPGRFIATEVGRPFKVPLP